MKQFLLKNKITFLIVLVVVLSLVPTLFFYWQYQNAQKQLEVKTNPDTEIEETIKKVGLLMELPEGEKPTIATVTDPSKLANQTFFQAAKTDDKVLIFTQAKKAVLYRPATNKIIDIAPVNIGTTSASIQTEEGISNISGKVVLYNGTPISGLTRNYENVLKEKTPGLLIVGRGNAGMNNYTKSLLIDLTGKKSLEAQNLAETLDLTLSNLPADETATGEADFLIILGADKSNL